MRLLICLTLALAATSPAVAAADAKRGATLYQARCGSCHSASQNRTGPKHAGVVGRKAGSIIGYVYSKALLSTTFVWDAEHLDKWLSGPATLVPGTKMRVTVADPNDRADIIAYLATLN
jgi:cytochrome c